MPEELAYDITRVLFEQQPALAAIHPEARHLSRARASSGSPAPFHPGALRYYRGQISIFPFVRNAIQICHRLVTGQQLTKV
jgi:hypothetical protein